MSSAWVWWAAMGCGDGAGQPKQPAGETGAPTTASPDDTAPPADTDDTGTPLLPVALHGRVDWPAGATPDADLVVAAAHTTWQADTVTFGATIAGAEVAADGSFTIELPARPPSDALVRPSPTEHPDLVGALYLLTAFVPATTGSVFFAEGRPIRGMAFDRLLVWLDPDTLGDADWPGGWTLMDTGLAGSYNPPACLVGTTQPLLWRWADGYPTVHPIDEDDLVIGLRGASAPLTVAGAVSLGAGAPDRLAGVPQQVALGESTSLEPVLDVDLSGDTFSTVLSEPPPLTHNLGGESAWQVTLAYLLQYTDNGDGRWTLAGDGAATVTQSACADGSAVYLRYTRDVETWRGMRLLECQGGQVGWRLLTLDPTGATYAAVSREASAALTVSSACRY